MRQIFAFESIEEYKNNADNIAILNNKLALYKECLVDEFELKELRKVDYLMIEIFKPKYGDFSLDEFGSSSYNQTSIASIMLNYWRSAAAIHYLVEECHGGDAMKVFNLYHEWHEKGREIPLTDFFGVNQF